MTAGKAETCAASGVSCNQRYSGLIRFLRFAPGKP
jgi:hypothetical protein